MATIIGGSMLGDNLSIVSDTTIASVSTQGANMRDKFRFNFKISLVASLITIIVILLKSNFINANYGLKFNAWFIISQRISY